MSANRSSGGSATCCRMPGHRGRKPASPKMVTRTASRARGPPRGRRAGSTADLTSGLWSRSVPGILRPVDRWMQPASEEQPVDATRVDRLRRPRWYTRPFVVIVAVTAIGGGLRFYHLSSPHAFVFDEVYYAKDGCFDAGFPYRKCQLAVPGEQTFTVHPPLGRWIIAGAVSLFSKP